MIKTILLALSLLGLTSAAYAADLPRRDYAPAPSPYVAAAPAVTWTGFNVGLNGGYSWGKASTSNTLVGGVAFPNASGDMNGLFGGAQIGYNHQFGMFVVGLETDLQAASGKTSFGAPAGTAQADMNWFGTVRGRIGIAPFERLLVYGTGGFAYASIDGTLGAQTQGKVHTGYAYGAGVEYMLTPKWSVKGEYLRLDLGKKTYAGTIGGTPVSTDGRYRADLVRAGLNYRF